MTSFGIASLADTPVAELAGRAGRLEAAGFDQLWLADERLLRNVYVGLAAMAAGPSGAASGRRSPTPTPATRR